MRCKSTADHHGCRVTLSLLRQQAIADVVREDFSCISHSALAKAQVMFAHWRGWPGAPALHFPVTSRSDDMLRLLDLFRHFAPRCLFAAGLMLVLAVPSSAQVTNADAKLTTAQKAFEALPEPLRKSIQFDLTFVGGFTGNASGSFGPLTYQAIQTFERSAKFDSDGILSVAEQQLLALDAAKARQVLKYSILSDARSGARIGVPQALLNRTEANTFGGSRWQSSDGRVTLDTRVGVTGETLATLFEKATAPSTTGRKVVYKLLRADFYVISGETQAGKFYSRMAQGSDGALRGFSIGYDKAVAAQVDRLVIAIANGFEPFPAAGAAATVVAAPPAAPRVTMPVAAAAGSAFAPATPRGRLGTAVLLDASTVLAASASVKDCTAIQIGSRRVGARILANDATLGVALLRLNETLDAGGAVPVQTTAAGPLTVWSFAAKTAAPELVFAEASGDIAAHRVSAPLQTGGAGAALIGSDGTLAGVVTGDPGTRKTVAGIVPVGTYSAVLASDILALAGRHGVVLIPAAPHTANGIAKLQKRYQDSVLPVFCSI
jgi:peptidoglycan hydrolase-like protein with peptidoglycan-binding domain